MRKMKATVVWKYLAAVRQRVVCFLIFSRKWLRPTHLSPMLQTKREKTLKVTCTLNIFCFSIVQEKITSKSNKMYGLHVFVLTDSLRVLHYAVVDKRRFFAVVEWIRNLHCLPHDGGVTLVRTTRFSSVEPQEKCTHFSRYTKTSIWHSIHVNSQ